MEIPNASVSETHVSAPVRHLVITIHGIRHLWCLARAVGSVVAFRMSCPTSQAPMLTVAGTCHLETSK